MQNESVMSGEKLMIAGSQFAAERITEPCSTRWCMTITFFSTHDAQRLLLGIIPFEDKERLMFGGCTGDFLSVLTCEVIDLQGCS